MASAPPDMNPNPGPVQAKVPRASAADVDAAVVSAAEAQKKWAAFNPQRRARVMMRFVDLVNKNIDELAETLSLEHGKTVEDSKGDIQRGIEVIEFACGIPHLLKGEYTEGAGTGIDVYSLRQPLGVVAGITPFNFPAMIPLWKAGPALACGNAFILKRACPPASSRSYTATRKPSTRSWSIRRSRPSASSAAPTSRSTSTRPPPPTASARSASAGRRTT